MASRLERLVSLLETGSTNKVRSTAAEQLGEIAKQHPADLHNLLGRVLVHLRSKSWETRVAAGLAIEAIAKNFVSWEPTLASDVGRSAESEKEEQEYRESLLNFSSLDISNVVQSGSFLLASSGKEFDATFSNLDPRERILLQKKQLKERLGIGTEFMDDLLDDTDVLGSNTDLNIKQESRPNSANSTLNQQKSVQDIFESAKIKQEKEFEDSLAGLSARERNRLKRKKRLGGKAGNDRTVKPKIIDISTSSSAKGRLDSAQNTPTTESPTIIKKEPQENGKHVVAHKTDEEEAKALGIFSSGDEWPFEGFCEQLCLDLFSPVWEIRHGAGVGLREVIKLTGNQSGKIMGITKKQNDERHHAWLEDVSIRLLCVLALDRFGDYGGDQAMAPVRETCAQALGVVMSHCKPELCLKVVQDGFLKMVDISKNLDTEGTLRGKGWQVRHGALVGLKYWMAVRKDLLSDIFQYNIKVKSENGIKQEDEVKQEDEIKQEARSESMAFKAIVDALKDGDDDVRAVASSSLLPVVDILVNILSPDVVYDSIVITLWDCLEELDDLTSATGFVMDLLSQITEIPAITEVMQSRSNILPLSHLIPRLYPFFRHAVLNVRLSVVNTIYSFLRTTDLIWPDRSWIKEPLLCLIFQNFILELKPNLIDRTLEVWTYLVSYIDKHNILETELNSDTFPTTTLSSWFALAMMPVGFPLNTKYFIPCNPNDTSSKIAPHDRAVCNQDLTVASEDDIILGRLSGCTALGRLVNILLQKDNEVSKKTISELSKAYTTSGWVGHRLFCNVMIDEWAIANKSTNIALNIPLAKELFDINIKTLSDADSGGVILYNELLEPLRIVRTSCVELLDYLQLCGVRNIPQLPQLPIKDGEKTHQSLPAGVPTFNLQVVEEVIAYTRQILDRITDGSIRLDPKVTVEACTKEMEHREQKILGAITTFKGIQERKEIQAFSAMASSVISMNDLPKKLNPIIRSLMSSLKEEVNIEFQKRSAFTISRLFKLCFSLSKPKGIVDKITRNLVTFLAMDPSVDAESTVLSLGDGIIALEVGSLIDGSMDDDSSLNYVDSVDMISEKKSRGKKDQSKLQQLTIEREKEAQLQSLRRKNRLIARGAEFAIIGCCNQFGDTFFEKLDKIKQLVFDPIKQYSNDPSNIISGPELNLEQEDAAKSLIIALNVYSKLALNISKNGLKDLILLLPDVCKLLQCYAAKIRHMAARAIASIASVSPFETMQAVISHVLPYASSPTNVTDRQGAVECIHYLVKYLDYNILPYIIFLIVPLLGRMSDPSDTVRLISTNVFAQLVKLMPLESGVPDPEGFSKEMIDQKKNERKFIGQLVGSEKVEDFSLPVAINADLRNYQKEGISWLAFLNKYGLHGILCDDMGLGKTLQSICIVAADHYNRAEKYKETKAPDCAPAPSLVIVPSTLAGHWAQEIKTYAPFMKTLTYIGSVAERTSMAHKFKNVDVVITSYDVARNDIDRLGKTQFNYCILDEGHIIKNPKSKLTRAVKTINAFHRLILSGTPIQNNVLELWSLFDFLMPGFLGTEQQFNIRFSKPILASRDAKSTSKEQEAGALAVDALHKQVLPFLLRRMKENVLDDLPPKIIQDYYCELSELQKILYQDFSKSSAKSEAENDLLDEDIDKESDDKKKNASTHVFAALQYLHKVCNHPSLVLTPKHPKYSDITKKLAAQNSNLKDLKHAPKILALKQLLLDCGIGTDDLSKEDGEDSTNQVSESHAVAPHRALIFCQSKLMLDIIENDLFKKKMPSVTFMRLDGSTPPADRHPLVNKFNGDPSIDVLLLTTHVGGLGLTLTGADTVIFVEHDWNPMKDLQAMDRAHRLGQKRVVNVYRLITRGTLEEKIMSLQKFKLNIASTVVNQDNSTLKTMDTDQILDLFSAEANEKSDKPGEQKKKEGNMTTKEFINSLGDMDHTDEYEDLNMDDFLNRLN